MLRRINSLVSQLWGNGDGPEEYAAVHRFPLNTEGRDFVVGDIHGMFSHLSTLLEELEFDAGRDRLFSVGDLVDRGPESGAALEWLAHPWFHACRGNHEQFVIDSENGKDLEFWVRYNGGEWWLDLDTTEQARFRRAFDNLPLALEVETHSGWVGIVHADVPADVTWDEFVELLEGGVAEASVYALYSRGRVHGQVPAEPVAGKVERVYCGHTPVREPVTVANVHFIDTAAVYVHENYAGARLTMVEIHPRAHQEYHIRTDRVV